MVIVYGASKYVYPFIHYLAAIYHELAHIFCHFLFIAAKIMDGNAVEGNIYSIVSMFLG